MTIASTSSSAQAAGVVDAAVSELLRLHRDGLLGAEYPQIAPLLSVLPDAELLRMGQLLGRLDPRDVQASHPSVPALRVAVTGHGTLPVLIPALTAQLARHGVLLVPHATDFDSYIFELGDSGSSLYSFGPQLALAVLDASVIIDELPVPWTPADVAEVFERKLALIEGLCDRFAADSAGTLVLNTMPLPRSVAGQLVDHRSRARLGAIWREGNARLLRMSEGCPSVLVVDLDTLVAEGLPVEDSRLSIYAKAHLTDTLLARLARDIGHLGAHLVGRGKKCLVLDLDDTIWGGTLGEDGPEGIEVGQTHRGEAFVSFQRLAKQLTAQGVLLAAASKNDLEPVLEVLREHPRMVLREEDFVRVKADWRPKALNLRELAEELNIGVDSLVFVDDSYAECGLVRTGLPSVAVVEVGDDPAEHVDLLLRDGWFDMRELTSEDHARAALYRDELARKDFQDSFGAVGDFLKQLDVRVRLSPVGEPELARISQLTLRTNQFNMTTERLQSANVAQLAQDPDHLVLGIHVSDRFGDSGLVGAAFAHVETDTLHIDNFVLSCRVFSRGVEQAVLSSILRQAREDGIRQVVGRYRPTAKNGKFHDFYLANGFENIGENGSATSFRHDLQAILPLPAHLRVI